MISKTDLWGIFKVHEQETGITLEPLMRNHILEIVQRVDKFENNGVLQTKEELILCIDALLVLLDSRPAGSMVVPDYLEDKLELSRKIRDEYTTHLWDNFPEWENKPLV